MRLKSELYQKEQDEIVEKIITILDLENKNTYTLYELDNNEEIQKQIMELIPEIRKWYSFNGIKAVGEPNRIKRPWLSIIKQLTKSKYNLLIKELRYTDKGIQIKTQHYTFLKIII
jgi:hypothetical protein